MQRAQTARGHSRKNCAAVTLLSRKEGRKEGIEGRAGSAIFNTLKNGGRPLAASAAACGLQSAPEALKEGPQLRDLCAFSDNIYPCACA